MRKMSAMKLFDDGGVLEQKYFAWMVLMFVKALQLSLLPGFKAFDLLLVGVLGFYVIKDFNRPKELIYLFFMAYFTNFRHWFTGYAIIGGGEGMRILLVDILIIYIGLMVFLKILHQRQMKKFFLMGMIGIVMAFWIFNFLRGMSNGGFGYVIGEGRFYFASIFLFGIVNTFDVDVHKSLDKWIKIISICSINVAFIVVVIVLFGTGKGVVEEGRFNPGNGITQLLLYGLLISFLDYMHGTRKHVLTINPVFLIGFYLGIIALTGVRSIMILAAGIMVYFLFISHRLTFARKVTIIGGMVLIVMGALTLEPVQKVVETQMKYITIASGGSKSKHATTSTDFRKKMWEIFLDKLTDDNSRVIFGRPFGMELIDISSLNWAGHSETMVDNSLAHNDYIAISMTNGMVFTGILVLILLIYTGRAFLLSIHNKANAYYLVFLGWSLFGQMFQSGTNAEIKHYGWSVLLWVHVGLLALLFNHIKFQKTEWRNQKYPSSRPRSIKASSLKTLS